MNKSYLEGAKDHFPPPYVSSSKIMEINPVSAFLEFFLLLSSFPRTTGNGPMLMNTSPLVIISIYIHFKFHTKISQKLREQTENFSKENILVSEGNRNILRQP